MIHSLYRDFFQFIKSIGGRDDRWRLFVRHYYGKHRDFLSRVWFHSQGFTEENIRERVERIRPGDYAWLQGALELYNIELKTAGILSHCEKVFPNTVYCTGHCDAYLFIGFFSPDAFVIEHHGESVICVGLERYRRFRHYPLLLAHEFCHCVINRTLGPGNGRFHYKLVKEGLAVHFSKIAFPGRRENEYLFLRTGAYNDMQTQKRSIFEKLLREGERIGDIFHGQNGELPNRIGYYIGYLMVKEFIERTGKTDPVWLIEHAESIYMDFFYS
ncbi:MAG: hypothetical protein AMS17_05025 [Spirochaetes bacterium DG_61]|nr:MAG: hypothetical protein AMS17_05025 [Spirochaetes bacterium DG_61]